VKLPNHFTSPKWSVEPGEKFSALWGTGYDSGRAFVELECDGKTLKSYWTAADRTQELDRVARHREDARRADVAGHLRPRKPRLLQRARRGRAVVEQAAHAVKWESFRSKLTPGQKETWTAVVTGPDAKRTAAEMVATLYDASLDHDNWPQRVRVPARVDQFSERQARLPTDP
jgi:hypothetical protein